MRTGGPRSAFEAGSPWDRQQPRPKRPPTLPEFLLRQWRDIRGKTQLDLSFDAGVSQKHISFVESGRSIPSRQILLDLAQALDMPLRERNALLVAAAMRQSIPTAGLTGRS